MCYSVCCSDIIRTSAESNWLQSNTETTSNELPYLYGNVAWLYKLANQRLANCAVPCLPVTAIWLKIKRTLVLFRQMAEPGQLKWCKYNVMLVITTNKHSDWCWPDGSYCTKEDNCWCFKSINSWSLCYHQVAVLGHEPVFDWHMKLSILASVGLLCNLILM